MAWYKTGTVAVAATKVTGTGTNFLDAKFGIGPGQAFLLPASGTVKIYEIASVEDATHLTLTTTAGTVAAGAAYAVMSFYTDSIPDFSKRLAAQLGYYQSQMDGWQTIMTGNGAVSVTAPDGTVVNISSFAKLTSDMAKAYTDGGLLNATVTPNSLGNVTDFNIYYQTANANAVIANGYPIAKAGTLYVTKSAYGCQQMYITFQGETYTRGLTGAFTPASPNWGDWVPQYGKLQVPLTTGVTGNLPIANGGTGASDAVSARNNLALGINNTVSLQSLELYNSTPFIDFHFNNSSADYTSRIIQSDSVALSVAGLMLDSQQSYRSRRGMGGAALNVNPWNFYWSSGLEAWVQQTQVGTVQMVSSSDAELKNIKDRATDKHGALAEILQWLPTTFSYKARGVLLESDDRLGFIANELIEASPECVEGEGLKEGWDELNPVGAYTLNEVAMIAKLTLALQAQQELIEDLKNKIATLTAPKEPTS